MAAPDLTETWVEFLPWFAAWHLYYWIWHFVLSASMPSYTDPNERIMTYYTKKLRLAKDMPAAEKKSRVSIYFQNYWIACIVSGRRSDR